MLFLCNQKFFRIGPDDSSDFILRRNGVQEGSDILSADYERCSRVNRAHFILGRSCDDGESLGDAAVVFSEFLEDPAHEEDGVSRSDVVLDLLFSLPLVKEIRRNQAATAESSFSEHGFFEDAFTTGVEHQFFMKWEPPGGPMQSFPCHNKRFCPRVDILFFMGVGGKRLFTVSVPHFTQHIDDV